MDRSKSVLEFADTQVIDNLQKLNTINQKLMYYENENNEVVQSNCKPSETVSDITENNIVAMDYTAGRTFNEKEDVMHFSNINAVMCAREKEYQYILKENNELKYTINKQRILEINHYDEILDSLDKLKEELEIKELKITQLLDDINLLKMKQEEQNGIKELFGGRITEFSGDLESEYFDDICDDYQTRNELNQGKLMIAEEINQLRGSDDIVGDVENNRMPELISILINIIREKAENFEAISNNLSQYVEDQNQLLKEIDNYKEWQERLESENGRLNIEIVNHKLDRTMLMNKENECNDIKREYSHLQYEYNEVCKKYDQLKSLIDQYKEQLTEKEINCVDNDNIIKTLNLNISELTNKFNQAMLMSKNDKEKYKKIESYTSQMMEEFTDHIQGKNVEIVSVKDECSILKQNIYSAEEEIQNLKHNIVTLEFVLSKKNKENEIEKENKTQREQQLQFNDLLHVLSTLEQQMSIMLDDMFTCKKKIVSYENVLHNLQNAIQQQYLTKNRWIAKHENIKKEYNKLIENEQKKKQSTSLEHQLEIDNLQKDYNLKITTLVDTNMKLRLEIQDLKKNLNQKDSFLTKAEKLASLQLYNASNQINNLTHILTTQTIEINDMKKQMSKMQLSTNKPYTNDIKFQIYKECSIDLMRKFKLQNRMLERQCKMCEDKIKHLENNSSSSNNTLIRNFK